MQPSLADLAAGDSWVTRSFVALSKAPPRSCSSSSARSSTRRRTYRSWLGSRSWHWGCTDRPPLARTPARGSSASSGLSRPSRTAWPRCATADMERDVVRQPRASACGSVARTLAVNAAITWWHLMLDTLADPEAAWRQQASRRAGRGFRSDRDCRAVGDRYWPGGAVGLSEALGPSAVTTDLGSASRPCRPRATAAPSPPAL